LACLLVFPVCLSAIGQPTPSPSIEWVSNQYCDFTGDNLVVLQELDKISSSVLTGCERCFNWPRQLSNKLLVRVVSDSVPHVQRSPSGKITLILGPEASTETRVEWITRGLLTQFGAWKGIEAPPPLWLVHATAYAGIHSGNSQMRTLLLRRLQAKAIPTLAQRIQVYDRMSDPGWDYLIFLFLESSELAPAKFKERLEQFWTNGYDWTQLGLFFSTRYPGLNGAELELLWKTFVSETFFVETAVCLSEAASLKALELLAKVEIMVSNQIEVLAPDTWYLYRTDAVALTEFSQKQIELRLLARSIHPYFFNACHSLDGVFESLETGDLEVYRENVRQFNQDMLDAQQLSFETDRLLEKLCGKVK
jgi:hypothetical protein